MSPKSIYYSIYESKSTEELMAVLSDNMYPDDAKLTAISVLRDRQVPVDDFISIEEGLIQKRNSKAGPTIALLKYNTGFDRFLALVIDGFILGLVTYLIRFLYDLNLYPLIVFLNIFSIALHYLYNILMHGYRGQTLGKMALDIKIYDKSETKPISYKQAVVRDIVPLSLLLIAHIMSYFIGFNNWGLLAWLSYTMTFLLLFWSILEIITMLFNRKRRAVHDFLAGTVVLKMEG